MDYNDKDFEEYVKKFAIKHGISEEEAKETAMVTLYNLYLRGEIK